MTSRLIYSGIFSIIFTSLAFAHSGPGSSEKSKTRVKSLPLIDTTPNHKEIHGKLIQEKRINDFDLRFKIVDVKDSVPDGGSHNLLVNIKRNGKTRHKLSITAIVEDNKGRSVSRSMMNLGDWYMAGYDFIPGNKYLITVSFKSINGKTLKSTITYQ